MLSAASSMCPRRGECIDEPERACKEETLRAAETIFTRVAVEQRSLSELCAYCADRRSQSLTARIVVAEENCHQQARIQFGAPRRPHVALSGFRPAMRFYKSPDGFRLAFPQLQTAIGNPPRASKPRGAIKRDPAHHLGVDEVDRLAPY